MGYDEERIVEIQATYTTVRVAIVSVAVCVCALIGGVTWCHPHTHTQTHAPTRAERRDALTRDIGAVAFDGSMTADDKAVVLRALVDKLCTDAAHEDARGARDE